MCLPPFRMRFLLMIVVETSSVARSSLLFSLALGALFDERLLVSGGEIYTLRHFLGGTLWC